MSLEEIIESRIRDAMSAGRFSNLPGEGRRQRFDPAENLSGNNWLGYKVLRDGGMLPAWLLLAREIEREQEELARLDEEHEALVRAARETGDWPRFYPGIARLRRIYEESARALRLKQDQFNVEAPSIRLERPGIWIEYHLDRLDSRISSPLP
ncbi:MAG: DUF1992 domain-containing protein [Dehalococcoidia bacterium]|nr:DUF1992 domain-containing protein [Dehalococcoidia bacterium]